MGRELRMPPKIKILEAAGSIGDGRVNIVSDEGSRVIAKVVSSMGDKVYDVFIERVSGTLFRAYSNDNGTLLRGYIGYPIISVLMVKGLLPRDARVEESLKGIPWKVLNEKFKSYDKVLEEVNRIVESKEGDLRASTLKTYMDTTYRELSRYKLVLSRAAAGT
ncbi:MAG: hypothetical protein P3X22_001585 [Thermoprotei archaeon]|nr:hypothetical protein [Thermoprotei archaeon]